MNPVVAYVICAAAILLALSDLRELFIAWYSGAEPKVSAFTKVRLCVQVVVNAAAMWLALRSF